MDTVDKATRSKIMSSVGQRNTGAEIKIRKALHSFGLRYRLHYKSLPGSPDIVFPKYRAVIFVHGCFWHVHGCKYSMLPGTRREFWREKFEANKKRDSKNYDALTQRGWRVFVVWECLIKHRQENELRILCSEIFDWLKSSRRYRELGDTD